jgi:hypothetical protein
MSVELGGNLQDLLQRRKTGPIPAPPIARSIGGNTGFLSDIYRVVDSNTGKPILETGGRGIQIAKVQSESYAGVPGGSIPLVSATDFQHTPRNFISTGNSILRNSSDNRGLFVSTQKLDPATSALTYRDFDSTVFDRMVGNRSDGGRIDTTPLNRTNNAKIIQLQRQLAELKRFKNLFRGDVDMKIRDENGGEHDLQSTSGMIKNLEDMLFDIENGVEYMGGGGGGGGDGGGGGSGGGDGDYKGEYGGDDGVGEGLDISRARVKQMFAKYNEDLGGMFDRFADKYGKGFADLFVRLEDKKPIEISQFEKLVEGMEDLSLTLKNMGSYGRDLDEISEKIGKSTEILGLDIRALKLSQQKHIEDSFDIITVYFEKMIDAEEKSGLVDKANTDILRKLYDYTQSVVDELKVSRTTGSKLAFYPPTPPPSIIDAKDKEWFETRLRAYTEDVKRSIGMLEEKQYPDHSSEFGILNDGFNMVLSKLLDLSTAVASSPSAAPVDYAAIFGFIVDAILKANEKAVELQEKAVMDVTSKAYNQMKGAVGEIVGLGARQIARVGDEASTHLSILGSPPPSSSPAPALVSPSSREMELEYEHKFFWDGSSRDIELIDKAGLKIGSYTTPKQVYEALTSEMPIAEKIFFQLFNSGMSFAGRDDPAFQLKLSSYLYEAFNGPASSVITSATGEDLIADITQAFDHIKVVLGPGAGPETLETVKEYIPYFFGDERPSIEDFLKAGQGLLDLALRADVKTYGSGDLESFTADGGIFKSVFDILNSVNILTTEGPMDSRRMAKTDEGYNRAAYDFMDLLFHTSSLDDIDQKMGSGNPLRDSEIIDAAFDPSYYKEKRLNFSFQDVISSFSSIADLDEKRDVFEAYFRDVASYSSDLSGADLGALGTTYCADPTWQKIVSVGMEGSSWDEFREAFESGKWPLYLSFMCQAFVEMLKVPCSGLPRDGHVALFPMVAQIMQKALMKRDPSTGVFTYYSDSPEGMMNAMNYMYQKFTGANPFAFSSHSNYFVILKAIEMWEEDNRLGIAATTAGAVPAITARWKAREELIFPEPLSITLPTSMELVPVGRPSGLMLGT